MAKASPATRKSPRRGPAAPGERGWQWITDAALLLACALVAARMLMSEPLVAALGNPQPGSSASPLGPGPGTGLVVDLLCWLPAIAVLLRRLLDSRYTLRFTFAFVAMGLLGLWAMASMAWSADKFSAVVGAFGLSSAMILLWAVAQTVRSWVHVRCVAGICTGLLLALAVRGYTDHFIEQPMMRANWETQKTQVMRDNNWTENSPEFHQFQLRVLSGQAMGFSQSPNTYAGLLVLLGTVTTGLILDRPWKMGKVIAILAVIAIVAPLIRWTQCRAAYATPVLTVACLAVLGWKGRWLASHARSAFIGAAAAIVAGFVAVVGYGLWHGNLIHSSLTFRWWYWVGSARIIKTHPLLGVGWGNFGAHYLAVRLPIASEEIQDPHNFIVRFFAELGAIGAALLLFWLVWMAWKMTAGASDRWENAASDAAPRHGRWLGWVLAAPLAGILINLPASVDFSQSSNFITLEITNRVYWLAAMVAGMGVALLRREPARRGEIVLALETAPARWTVRAILVGIGIFLIHNLIEFGIFELGPMLLMALLCGAALGARTRTAEYDADLPARRKTGPLLSALAAAFIAWLAAIILLAAPVAIAEGDAESADALIRAGNIPAALSAYASAAATCPYNARYLRAAAYAAMLRNPPDAAAAMTLLDRAMAIDPLSIDAVLMRARLQLLPPAKPASIEGALADYRQALAIDPNNVRLRLQFAHLLQHTGRSAEARHEYAKALKLNDDLEPHDPKRLSPQEIGQTQAGLTAEQWRQTR